MADPQIRAIVRAVERLAERAVTKITLDVTANLVETTPVDTGWARANWVPSIGQPFIADLATVSEAPTASDAAGAASEQGAAVVGVAARYRLLMGRTFVTNNVTYITELNDGKSRQAPAAFVQRAIAKAVTLDIRRLTL